VSVRLGHIKRGERIASVGRGVQFFAPPLLVDPRFSSESIGVLVRGQEVVARPGVTRFPTVAQSLGNVPLSGSLHVRVNNNLHTVVATKTKLWYESAGAWVDGQHTTAFTGTDGDPFGFATVFGDLYMSNGVDKIWKWRSPTDDLGNGVGKNIEVATSFPSRFLAPFANRLFAAYTIEGGVHVSDRLRWCASGNTAVWDAITNLTAGRLDTVDHPGPITGIYPFNNFLAVLKRDSILRLFETGQLTPSFILQEGCSEAGCIEGRTLVEVDGLLYFLGRNNVYAWDGVARQPTPIGTSVRTRLFSELNRSELRKAFAFYHELYDEIWFVIPTVAALWPDVAYVYNRIEDAWSRTPFDATCHVYYPSVVLDDTIDSTTTDGPIDEDSTPIDATLTGASHFQSLLGRTSNQLFKLDETTTTDVSTAISKDWRSSDSRFLDEDELERLVTVNRVWLTVRLAGQAPSVEVSISGDGGEAWASCETKVLPGVGVFRVPFSAHITLSQARVRITTTGQFALIGYSYEYVERAELR
jgi:hypothetical protein